MMRAVFLDRDGVLNRAVVQDRKPYSPAGLDSLEVMPGAERALARLRQEGFLLLCVTNQPDVSRGTASLENVQRIHDFLAARLPVDEFFVCPHDDADRCHCRKPAPGLLLRAAGKHQIDLGASYLIGDRWRDIDAGATAGCKTVLIEYGYDERRPVHRPDAYVASLPEAVDWILDGERLSAKFV